MGKYDAKGEGEIGTNPRNMDDPIDRKRAPALDKLVYICDKAADIFGQDPRAGGFSFVGQCDLVEQVVSELPDRDRKLQQAVIMGSRDGDIVAWWVHRKSDHPIPIRVRMTARSENLFLLPDHLVIPSTMADRKLAAEVRMALWKGEIRVVQ